MELDFEPVEGEEGPPKVAGIVGKSTEIFIEGGPRRPSITATPSCRPAPASPFPPCIPCTPCTRPRRPRRPLPTAGDHSRTHQPDPAAHTGDPLLDDAMSAADDMIGYEDIGGMTKQLSVLSELIDLPLKKPEVFEALGVRPPRGVLIHGPPG